MSLKKVKVMMILKAMTTMMMMMMVILTKKVEAVLRKGVADAHLELELVAYHVDGVNLPELKALFLSLLQGKV
jgi:hypothetical protein